MLTPHLKNRASSFLTANWLGGGAVLAAFVAIFAVVGSARELAIHMAALATVAMAQGFAINREKSVVDADSAAALERCVYLTGAAALFHIIALFSAVPLTYAFWCLETVFFLVAVYFLVSDS